MTQELGKLPIHAVQELGKLPIHAVIDANVEKIKRRQPFGVEKGQASVFYQPGTYEWTEDIPVNAPLDKQKQYVSARFLWMKAYDDQGNPVEGMHRIYRLKQA